MYDISLKRKWDAEAVRMYQEGLEEQLKEAKKTALEAKATGKAEGFAEGERKKALETALEFKKMGLSIDQIAKATGLTIEEVEKLK